MSCGHAVPVAGSGFHACTTIGFVSRSPCAQFGWHSTELSVPQRGRGERKRPATGWDSLTPAELDVVRLVSDGLTNTDIAARLYVSPRTVQSHLTHVYAKLGLSSRVQLGQEFSARR